MDLPPRTGFVNSAWRGAKFGAKFTFVLLAVMVALPSTMVHLAHFFERGLSYNALLRFVVFGLGTPIVGAVLGGLVAALLFPIASLFDHRGETDKWTGFENTTSPWDSTTPAARSRDELLRRIVLNSSCDARD